ncbi:hypothetical protein CVD23_08805 [Bacillus sp. V33-4]|nr:hypothetical protein CVD23_08805 [Bacillus sp. V33-4]
MIFHEPLIIFLKINPLLHAKLQSRKPEKLFKRNTILGFKILTSLIFMNPALQSFINIYKASFKFHTKVHKRRNCVKNLTYMLDFFIFNGV